MSQRLFQDLPDSQLSPCVYLVSVVVARVVKVVADAEKVICFTLKLKQARKSSEDTQVAAYARFEKVWAG